MAFSFTIKHWLLAAALIYASVFCSKLGKAYDDQTQIGSESEHDPAQIVARAVLCFNDKFIYSSCEEDYRLNERGDINVPHDYTDQYCNGPCLTETHLVLNCIDNILSNFLFYNKATIQDVKDTVQAACSDGSERGNFNVAEHIEAEENNGNKAANQILLGLVLSIVIIGRGFLLSHVSKIDYSMLSCDGYYYG